MGNKASLMLQDEEIRQISEETGFSAQQIEKLYSRFTHLDRANCSALSKNDLLSIPELAINPLCDRLIEMFFGSGRNPEDEEERINFRQFMRVLAAFRTNSHLLGHGSGQATTDGITARRSGNSSGQLSSSRPKSVAVDLAFRKRHHNNQPSNGKATHLSDPSLQKAYNIRSDININNNIDSSTEHSAPALESLSECLRDKLYFLFKIYDADGDGRISFTDLRSILRMMVGNYIEDVQLDKIATRAFVEVDRDNDGFVEFGEFCSVFAGKDMDDKLRVRFF